MTEPLFFDTDCLSAFLWVRNESLLPLLFPGRIVIPAQVYQELSRPAVFHLRERLDRLLSLKLVRVQDMDILSEEYALYRTLTERPEKGYKVIGKGEASSIALAVRYQGIIASNNLRDILGYVHRFALKHLTTGDILMEACQSGLITEAEGNLIWSDMLAKKRFLGAPSFSEYLLTKKKRSSYD